MLYTSKSNIFNNTILMISFSHSYHNISKDSSLFVFNDRISHVSLSAFALVIVLTGLDVRGGMEVWETAARRASPFAFPRIDESRCSSEFARCEVNVPPVVVS